LASGADRIVHNLRQGSGALATHAAATVANLGSAISAQRAAAQAGAIPAVVEFLQRRGLPALDQMIGCSALQNLTGQSSSRAKAVVQAGALPVLARLARAPDEGVRGHAVSVMWNLLEHVTLADLTTSQALQMTQAQLDFFKLSGPGTSASWLQEAMDNLGALVGRHDGEEMIQAVAAAGVERQLVAGLQGGTYACRLGALAALYELLRREPLLQRVLPAVVAAGGLEAMVQLAGAGEDTLERGRAVGNLCLALASDEALARRAARTGAVLPLAQLLARKEMDPEEKGVVASCLALVLEPDGTRPELALLALLAGVERLQQMVRTGRDAMAGPAVHAQASILGRLLPSLGVQTPSGAALLQQIEFVAIDATRLLLRPECGEEPAVRALGLLGVAMLVPGVASAAAGAGVGRALQRWLQDPASKAFTIAELLDQVTRAALAGHVDPTSVEPLQRAFSFGQQQEEKGEEEALDLVALEQQEQQLQQQQQEEEEKEEEEEPAGSSAGAAAAGGQAAAAAGAAPVGKEVAAAVAADKCAACGAASMPSGKMLKKRSAWQRVCYCSC
jgi:hypothetical protein